MSVVRRRLITGQDIENLSISGEDLENYSIPDIKLSEDMFVTYYPELTPPVGVNNTYGTYAEWDKPDTVRTFIAGGIKAVLSGINTASNELITVEITLCFNDGTCNVVERTFSVDGTYYISDTILDVLKDNVLLTSIKARAKSNLATTTATVDLYIYITVM